MGKFKSRKHKHFLFIIFIFFLGFPYLNCNGDFKAINSLPVNLGSNSAGNNSDPTDQTPAPGDTPNTQQPPLEIPGVSAVSVSAKQGEDLVFQIKIDSNKSKPVTIVYETMNDTAIAGTDYLEARGTATIAAGQTSLKVNVKTYSTVQISQARKLSFKITASLDSKTENITAQGVIDPNPVAFMPKHISIGGFHTCAVTAKNTVQCVGNNDDGQLGNGTKIGSATPVDVVGLQDVESVATSNYGSCAILKDKTVKCWGLAYTRSLTPVDTGLKNIIQVGVSNGVNIFALTDGGQVIYTAAGFSPTIIKLGNVVLDKDIKQISVKSFSFCALSTAGSVTCEGGASQQANIAVSGIKQIAVGVQSACGITAQDTVKCWGQNLFGEVSANPPSKTNVEYLPPTDKPGLTNVKTILAGEYHYCALIADGTMKCWGTSGQYTPLGYNTSSGFNPTPLEPTGLGKVQSMIIGSITSCALMPDFKYKCWGFPSIGNAFPESPVPVDAKLFGF